MPRGAIGVQVAAPDAPGLLREIERMERLGVAAVWATSEGADPLTLFAAAAVRTNRVSLGTAITRAATRHSVGMAQQAAVVGQLAPGRFRLGIGPFIPSQAAVYGPGPARPLAHLRAYIRAVKGLIESGAVDVEDAGVVAHGRLAGPRTSVPVMASALRPASFALCGEVADGAITWVCPWTYVRDTALPALRAGAASAHRDPPALVVHVPLCLSTDVEAVRAAIRERFAFYVRVPNYAAMFVEAGFPEAREGRWSDAMIDAVAVHGSEAAVSERLRTMLATGADEILASVVGVGSDPAACMEGALRLIAALGDAVGKEPS